MVRTVSNASGRTFTRKFNWLSYNPDLADRYFKPSDRKAIAIDPSYISKSGKCTPWVGYFWSGCAGRVKHSLEIIMGIGLIDIDKYNCITLKAEQSPDNITLEGFGSTLNDWYLKVIERYKE